MRNDSREVKGIGAGARYFDHGMPVGNGQRLADLVFNQAVSMNRLAATVVQVQPAPVLGCGCGDGHMDHTSSDQCRDYLCNEEDK